MLFELFHNRWKNFFRSFVTVRAAILLHVYRISNYICLASENSLVSHSFTRLSRRINFSKSTCYCRRILLFVLKLECLIYGTSFVETRYGRSALNCVVPVSFWFGLVRFSSVYLIKEPLCLNDLNKFDRFCWNFRYIIFISVLSGIRTLFKRIISDMNVIHMISCFFKTWKLVILF